MELQGNSAFSRPRPEPEETEENDLFADRELEHAEEAMTEAVEEGLEEVRIPAPSSSQIFEAAEEEEPPPVPVDSEVEDRPDVAPRKTSCPIRTQSSPGACLAELRSRHNYTLQQLADETKIREDYLVALEADDYKYLPQLVYVMGYIRKLCGLYGVSQEDADSLTAELREQLQYELPEDITKTVIDHEVSEENERKLKHLLILISGAVILVVAAVIVLSVWLILDLRSSSASSQSGVPFNENLLIQLQDPPEIRVLELK